jgi:hypothetical protein
VNASLDVFLESTMVGKRKQVKQRQSSRKVTVIGMAAARRNPVLGQKGGRGLVGLLLRRDNLPKPLAPEREKTPAGGDGDFRMYPHVYNVLAPKGRHLQVGSRTANRSKEVLNPLRLSSPVLEKSE